MKRSILAGLGLSALLVAACLGEVAAQPPGPGWGRGSGYATQKVGNPALGAKIAKDTCAACHGADGNSTDPRYPKLAGQRAAYLYWQLWAFKRGTRKSDIMAAVVPNLSDADIANVAAFFSEQTVRPDPVQDPRAAALGQRIFYASPGPGGGPSCAMCHQAGYGPGMMGGGMMGGMRGYGTGMMGAAANAPRLDGQHAAYIVSQLDLFASGKRPATVMGPIAAALSKSERRAVGAYLASR